MVKNPFEDPMEFTPIVTKPRIEKHKKSPPPLPKKQAKNYDWEYLFFALFGGMTAFWILILFIGRMLPSNLATNLLFNISDWGPWCLFFTLIWFLQKKFRSEPAVLDESGSPTNPYQIQTWPTKTYALLGSLVLLIFFSSLIRAVLQVNSQNRINETVSSAIKELGNSNNQSQALSRPNSFDLSTHSGKKNLPISIDRLRNDWANRLGTNFVFVDSESAFQNMEQHNYIDQENSMFVYSVGPKSNPYLVCVGVPVSTLKNDKALFEKLCSGLVASTTGFMKPESTIRAWIDSALIGIDKEVEASRDVVVTVENGEIDGTQFLFFGCFASGSVYELNKASGIF